MIWRDQYREFFHFVGTPCKFPAYHLPTGPTGKDWKAPVKYESKSDRLKRNAEYQTRRLENIRKTPKV